MRTSRLFPAVASLAAAAALLASLSPACAETRRWTNADGTRHLEAEFVELAEDGKVVLKKEDGVVLRIPMDALSIADRNFVRKQGSGGKDEPVKPKTPIKSTKKKLVGDTAIRKVLARRLKLKYEDVPLAEMLGDLKERIGVEMVVDGNSLSKAGVAFETPVSMNTAGMTLGTALQAALNKVDASWSVRHEVLMIVAKKKENGLTPVVYKITQPLRSRTIATDVIRNVAVPRWLETGGQGRIERLNRALVISQTPEVHAEIAEKYSKFLKQIVLSYGNGPQPVLRGLRQRSNFDLREVPLKKVLEDLGKKHKVKFEVDHVALGQKGIDIESPVTIQVKGVMVQSALGLMLDSLELTSRVDKGTVYITTPRDNVDDDELVTHSYDLRRLRAVARSSDIRDVLEDLVARETWDDHGGKGEIRRSENSRDTVVVKQTPSVHAQIKKLLSELLLSQ